MTRTTGYSAEELSPGMSASFTKTVTDDDIAMFASVSGDNNAIHLDEAYAATTASVSYTHLDVYKRQIL